MSEKQKWWQHAENIEGRKTGLKKKAYELMGRHEEQVLINRRDIMEKKDAWDVQEFITQMYVRQLLRHPAFQLLLALLLLTNAITIALRTNAYLNQKHYELFSTIDDIVLTILICEVLLGWLNGFWIFWKVFSVFGVTLFGAFVPKHFQNMGVALYTLFICITQDGWLDIYSDFQIDNREIAMEVGAAIYFAVFITLGAFIGLNLFVVVVTTNLEQMMKTGEDEGHLHISFNETEEEEWTDELPLVHCTEVRKDISTVPKEPLVGGPLCNLTEKTFDNFCLVLEAIQENLLEYKEIREELDMIIGEVRSILFNQEQESAIMRKYTSKSTFLSESSPDMHEVANKQDLITALVSREKVYESTTNMATKHRISH
uniref:cation channel sperm-associated protein 4 isoform X2 n=1 Tax=Arvicanthis niloticus TaxID=61156 RepID=UPI00148713CF|nr:cation channel sperm-associated protein 4 isoform X2 [Arvicanthis niloticus]